MHAHDSDSHTLAPEQSRPTSAIFQQYRPAGWWQRAITAVLALLVFVVAFVHYESDVDVTAFHPDESRWLNRAHYLEDLLDPFGPTWNASGGTGRG